MDRHAPLQQVQARRRAGRAAAHRHPARKPAHGAGAQTRQHDPPLPRLAHRLVEAVLAPHGQHVAHRAAADIDRVLGQQVRRGVDSVPREMEQRQDARLARPGREALVEARRLLAPVPGGGRQKADSGHRLAGQGEHQAIQGRAALLHREAAATHGEDPPSIVTGRVDHCQPGWRSRSLGASAPGPGGHAASGWPSITPVATTAGSPR